MGSGVSQLTGCSGHQDDSATQKIEPAPEQPEIETTSAAEKVESSLTQSTQSSGYDDEEENNSDMEKDSVNEEISDEFSKDTRTSDDNFNEAASAIVNKKTEFEEELLANIRNGLELKAEKECQLIALSEMMDNLKADVNRSNMGIEELTEMYKLTFGKEPEILKKEKKNRRIV